MMQASLHNPKKEVINPFCGAAMRNEIICLEQRLLAVKAQDNV